MKGTRVRKSRFIFTFVALAGAFLLGLVARTGGQTSGSGAAIPVPGAERHVVIVSIDGCRPDIMLRAKTPVLHGMVEAGAFTFYCETTDVAVTLPSHTSMLTGVQPAVHRINFNTDPPKGVYPYVPTVLELAHARGMTTGVFSTKSKFSLYTRPDTIDYVSISKESSSADDMGTAKDAAAAIVQHKPGVLLVHLGNTDRTGHASGWGSPEQMEALQGADAAIGVVVDALKQAGIYGQTLVIVSSDHGGSGLSHGDKLDAPDGQTPAEKDWRSRYVPWIATGPGIRKGFDLTSERTLTVHTEDTFSTACYFLGITPPGKIYGKPLTAICNVPPGVPSAAK